MNKNKIWKYLNLNKIKLNNQLWYHHNNQKFLNLNMLQYNNQIKMNHKVNNHIQIQQILVQLNHHHQRKRELKKLNNKMI